MKYLYLFFGWALGALALIAAAAAFLVFESYFSGFSFVLISLFLLPPVRGLVFARTSLALSLRTRSAIVIGLFLLAGYFWWQTMEVMVDSARVEQAARKSAEEAAAREEELMYFNENTDEIIRELEADLNAGNFSKVLRISRRYLASGNDQIVAIHKEARNRVTEREDAHRAEREALARSAREEQERLVREKALQKDVETIAAQATTAVSSSEKSVSEELEVGDLIDRVIAGEDFSGKTLIVRGVALNTTTAAQALVNLGTRETYDSRAFENFVSVYDMSESVRKGRDVSVRVLIESSTATKLGDTVFVTIESAFIGCVEC